jgi:hypothetical protein
VKAVERKKRMLRLTSTSHDDVPLLTCRGDQSAVTLLQTAVLACSSGALGERGY